MDNRLLQCSVIAGGVLAVVFLVWYFFDPFGGESPRTAVELRAELEGIASPEVRAEAAAQLGALRDPEGMPPLLAALGDENVHVRARAAAAIVAILNADFQFRADDPPERRRETIERIKQHWEQWKASGVAKE